MENKFKKLLDEALRIKTNFNRTKNYFQVSGYPHYENVVSNILAFYLDAQEEHRLSNLWLESLMNCYKNANADNSDLPADSFYNDDIIYREYMTEDQKRIDLLTTTTNGSVICVENKIYADLYNNLKSYSSELNKDEFKEYPNKIKIVLSIKECNCKDGFINILYKDLLKKVSDNLGRFIMNANDKWLIFMKEFMSNLTDFMEEKMEMNSEWQEFIKENSSVISEFFSKYVEDLGGKKDLLIKAEKRISQELPYENIKTKTFDTRGEFKGYTSLVVDFPKDSEGNQIAYEPYFVKTAGESESEYIGILYLAIWNRSKKNDILLKKLFPDAKPANAKGTWGDFLIVNSIEFKNYSEDEFVEKSMVIIKRIADYYNISITKDAD